jgi:mevalonate kinase
MQHYHSNGKLLLFGEYFVLAGAQALAIPTQLGQSLSIQPHSFLVKGLNWKSFDHQNNMWFEAYFDEHFDVKHSSDNQVARTLQTILFAAKELNSNFLSENFYYDATTHLQFNRQWGLGSSSTLIANIAQWAKIDALTLFFNSFKGSGYDIACAQSNTPILYEVNGQLATYKEVPFAPTFANNIAFVYLGKKQNSREGIQHFYQKNGHWNKEIELITAITQKAIHCTTLNSFMALMDEHEHIVAQALKLEKVKDAFFSNFEGSIKSLGAWGGDFIMVASPLKFDDIKNYFIQLGFTTIVPYNQISKQ